MAMNDIDDVVCILLQNGNLNKNVLCGFNEWIRRIAGCLRVLLCQPRLCLCITIAKTTESCA